MNLVWTEYAWDDYLFWQDTDKKIIKRINELVRAIMRTPYEGIGKPEALRFTLAGKWSRRINDQHRLVYEVNGDLKNIDRELVIYQCRYHY